MIVHPAHVYWVELMLRSQVKVPLQRWDTEIYYRLDISGWFLDPVEIWMKIGLWMPLVNIQKATDANLNMAQSK